MRRIALLAVVLLGSVAGAGAQSLTFYLHKSASPVSVPGGTTTLFLDQTAPAGTAPAVESASVPKKTAAGIATFIAPAFASPATLGLDFDVTVHLSANLAMNGCAGVAATIEHVDSAGVRTFLGARSVSADIPQGSMGGTAGFAQVTVPFDQSCEGPFENASIGIGESLAVTVSVFNGCKANRTVSLAFDATGAPGSAVFDQLPPPDPAFLDFCFDRCRIDEQKCVQKYVDALLKCHMKAEQKGLAVDPICVSKAESRFSSPEIGCIENAEARHTCPEEGRGPALKAMVDPAVAAVVQLIDPGYPTPVENKCSALKKKCAATLSKGLLTCNQKATKLGQPVDPLCTGKATGKFSEPPSSGCMEKAEAKPPCLMNGEAPSVQTVVEDFVEDVVCEIDGTIDCGSP
jgi:hypothetical protein